LNNIIYIDLLKKAGIFVCLFLCASIHAIAQDWLFEKNSSHAYDLVLKLDAIPARKLIQNQKTAEESYIMSLSETIELMATEDAANFNLYEDRFLSRLEQKTNGTVPQLLFLEAEMRLQWAFVYLKFGHEIDGILQLRQALKTAETCREKYPDFIPILKTTGVLQVIVGSVPEKYDWLLSLFGMKGEVTDGLHDLQAVSNSTSSVAYESRLILIFIQGFLLQQPKAAIDELKKITDMNPANRLLLFITSSLAIKNSDAKTALITLELLDSDTTGIPLPYSAYLKGEALLSKADYRGSIQFFQHFIKKYKGQNYIKDAHYKIGICYWLSGDRGKAMDAFEEARTKGKDDSEADKNAARNLSEQKLPNVKLSQVRYFTDGGFYRDAENLLVTITPTDLPTKHDQVEYYYRKARLTHKQNQLPAAKLFYKQTIEMAGDEAWYFAPNSCLQLGYIAIDEKDNTAAEEYFNRALSYGKHEYKNSIDTKARSALNQISRK
jgi:tetratricopeptide (TPR) repeat protein